VNEARTAKSFRAAGHRILRDEAAASDALSRLLGSRQLDGRVISTDDEAWAMRLGSLASLAQLDALAVVAERPSHFVRAHNVSRRVIFDEAIAGAIDEMQRSRSIVQLPARVNLADRRTTEAVIVAPCAAVQGVEGYLVGFRVGRSFGAADGYAVCSVAELAALEVLREAAAQDDAVARRQAFALYELARQALVASDLDDALQAIVELLVATIGHDLAQLWVLRPGGSLVLRAAQPREGLALEVARPRDNRVLARALAGETVRAHDPSLRSWLSRTTRDLIVAPLDSAAGVTGVLALGRWTGVYERDAEDMATECARFIGHAVFTAAARRHGTPLRGQGDDEAALTGS